MPVNIGTEKDKESPTEAQLVAQASKGDKDAYRVLVERYQPRVFAIAYEIVKNREDAEDIAQESFVKAYLSLHSFKGDSSFFTWLYRIVHNMALDVRRRLIRRGGGTLEYDEVKASKQELQSGSFGSASPTASEGPAEAMLNREKASRIQKALGEISEEHRSVVVLREIDGLSYEEIAKATGVSKGTVMSRLFYARKKLQEALHEFAPPPGTVAGSDSGNAGF